MLSFLSQLMAAVCLAAGLLLAGMHPVWPLAQAAGVLGLAVVCYRWPLMLAALFPGLLVIADGYPVTGQIVVNEWDSWLLGCFAGAGWGMAAMWENTAIPDNRSVGPPGSDDPALTSALTPALTPAGGVWRLELIVWGLLAVGTIASMLIGWFALPDGLAVDPFAVYFNRWNAVREGKGFLYAVAFALIWFVRVQRKSDAKRLLTFFQIGVLTALAYVSVGVAVERAVYQGLFDFTETYRATGPVWTMHVGGHHVDAILVLGFPLIWLGYRLNASVWQVAWRLAFSVLVGYAVVATLSRITLALVPLEVVALVAVNRGGSLTGDGLDGSGTHWLKRLGSRGVWCGVGLLLGCVAFASVLQIPTVRQRFDRSAQSGETRFMHWQDALGRNQNLVTQWLVGSGLGTVPTRVTSSGQRAYPPLQLQASADGESISVVMKPDWPVYLEHWTLDDGQTPMRVTGTVRSVGGPSRVSLIRCYKSLLHSYATTSKRVECGADQATRFSIELPPLNATKPGLRWSAVQSIATHVSGKQAVELSDLKLEYGGQLIDSFPTSKWMFTCDEHLTWRTKNGPLHVLLSSGLLGLAVLGCLVIPMLRPGSWFRSAEVSPIAIGLVGIVLMTSVSSLIDTPWITALTLSYVAVLGTRSP